MARGSRIRAWSGSGLAAALMLSAPAVFAQAAFDVASIKESTSLEAGGTMRLMPDGGVRVQHLPARALITMLQALLVERFQLAFHREGREVDGFALVRVRADRLGRDLKPSELNCEKDMATTPRCRRPTIGRRSPQRFRSNWG